MTKSLPTILTESEREFDELMDKLPVNDYRVNHIDLITNEPRLTARGTVIKSFLKSKITSAYEAGIARAREVAEGVKKKLPNYARYCQSRNGLYYCGNCEQAWEECSCSARNTGHVEALTKFLAVLEDK